MQVDDPLVSALRALCMREGGHGVVASEARVSKDNLSQILNGTKLPSGNPRSVGKRLRDRLASRYPGWTELQHSPAGNVPNYAPLAQDLSHHFVSDDLPYIAWEAIVKSPVPEVFRTVLPDDALAPLDLPQGTEVLWTTKRRAIPGRVVLVKDQHGQVHARECRQGREPGRWIAAPANPAYVAFDSNEITVLAVFKARLEPDDT